MSRPAKRVDAKAFTQTLSPDALGSVLDRLSFHDCAWLGTTCKILRSAFKRRVVESEIVCQNRNGKVYDGPESIVRRYSRRLGTKVARYCYEPTRTKLFVTRNALRVFIWTERDGQRVERPMCMKFCHGSETTVTKSQPWSYQTEVILHWGADVVLSARFGVYTTRVFFI